MRLPIQKLSTAELGHTWRAAQLGLEGFSRATAEAGSLIQSWVRGAPVLAMEHYPPSDVRDLAQGVQFFYHCHRAGGLEHGHVHLFAHATRTGRRRRSAAAGPGSDPSHLIAVGLDARGLPVSLFTVNRWVTGGYWLDTSTTLAWLRRWTLPADLPDHSASAQWLIGFLRMYLPVVERVLHQRDRWLTRQPDPGEAMNNQRVEVISSARIDWAADLQRLDTQAQRKGLWTP